MTPYAKRAAASPTVQDLPKDTPYVISGVSYGQFSPCRYYGGCKYNGRTYTYVPPTDELVRNDVVKALGKEEKEMRKLSKLATNVSVQQTEIDLT